jgi:hypothetical protein
MDFDEWQRSRARTRTSSSVGDRRRSRLIEQAPPEHRERLRALQSRIDLERSRAKTPLAATVRLQSMMWGGSASCAMRSRR